MTFFRKLLAPAAVALVLLSAATSAALAADTATDVFDGRATTGTPGGMPIDIHPTDYLPGSAGAFGLGYTYAANGQATGDVAGPFTYEEHGYLLFTAAGTFAGSRYDGGAFTLQSPSASGGAVKIVDTNPAAYQAVTRSAPTPQLDTLLRSYGHDVLTRLGLISTPSGLGKRGLVQYGAFTFTDSLGTFWGVSTVDSRHFLMKLTFVIGGPAVQPVQSHSNGATTSGENSRFPNFNQSGQR